MAGAQRALHGSRRGGYVVVDDYRVVPECGRAVDEFRSEHGIDEPLEDVDWTCVRWRRETVAPARARRPPPAARTHARRGPARGNVRRHEREVELSGEVAALRERLARAERRCSGSGSPIAGPRGCVAGRLGRRRDRVRLRDHPARGLRALRRAWHPPRGRARLRRVRAAVERIDLPQLQRADGSRRRARRPRRAGARPPGHRDRRAELLSTVARARSRIRTSASVGCVGAIGVRSIAWWEGSVSLASFVHRYGEHGGGDLPAFSWSWADAPPYARIGEVDTLDGFLLVLPPWTVRTLRFDESLGMLHGYDLDFCLQVRAAGRKVVTADFRAIHHHSLELVSDPGGWVEAHMRIAEKWDGRIPGIGAQPGTWKERARRAEAERDAARLAGHARALQAEAETASSNEPRARRRQHLLAHHGTVAAHEPLARSAGPAGHVIAFGTIVGEGEAFRRYTEPGIRRAAEPDSAVLTLAAVSTITRSYNIVLDAAARSATSRRSCSSIPTRSSWTRGSAAGARDHGGCRRRPRGTCGRRRRPDHRVVGGHGERRAGRPPLREYGGGDLPAFDGRHQPRGSGESTRSMAHCWCSLPGPCAHSGSTSVCASGTASTSTSAVRRAPPAGRS